MTRFTVLKTYIDYFTTIRNNKYITNVDLHEQPNGYWVALIGFKPFKDEKVMDLILTFGCNEADMPNRLAGLRCSVGVNDQVTFLTDDFFRPYRNVKDITWQELETLLFTIHDWVIEVIINSSSKFDVIVNLVNKYIPKDYFDDEDEFHNRIRARLGINKFNL